MMNTEVTMYQSAQVKTYLLCFDCEQRFSRLGESWAGGCSLQSDGTFPLRDLLLQQPPVPASEAENPWYFGAHLPQARAEELNYFAASVFWRGAVHSWTRNSTEPELALPSRAVEELRLFLLGKAVFPEGISILLEVHRHPEAMFNFPSGLSGDGNTKVSFTVYGLTFYLSVSTTYPDGEPLPLSLSRFPFPMMVAEIAANAILERSAQKAELSVQKGKLVKDFPKQKA